MNDNINSYMNGYTDAQPFNMGANGEVHRVESGRIDPNLTQYVGSEAAKELRILFSNMLDELTYDPMFDGSDYRARLDNILGLLHK